MTDWTANSNEALTLSLVRAKEDKEVLTEGESYENFHPTFTYPIFGDDEKIYGYEDLNIDYRFASGSLNQFLNVKYENKLDASETVDDVEGILAEVIPKGYLTNEEEFQKRVEDDAINFKPTGQLIYSYARPLANGKGKGSVTVQELDSSSQDVVEFEVYHTTWATPGFREYHRRMQIFILLYIEAGSFINEEEDTWEFVVLFEKRKRKDCQCTYHFVGYSSLYPFFHFPDKIRLRLSQFVIIPPYQHQGHGSELYRAIYNYVKTQPQIAELTVEDPAEAFEDLRDRNDLKMLLNNETFMEEGFGSGVVSHGGGRVGGIGRHKRSGKGGDALVKGRMGPPVDRKWAEKWRLELKIASRQFHRLLEMLLLQRLDPSDVAAARAFRLQVKERLYRFNFEVLEQLEKEEKLEKLQETFESVREDYQRILAMMH